MSTLTARIAKTQRIVNSQFTLEICVGASMTKLRMEMNSPVLTTRSLPKTHGILAKSLPSIFNAPCINQENLPFHEEVKKTEIGHLFEHILLEYLSDLKQRAGYPNPVFKGVTRWDWSSTKQGVFYISISSGNHDLTYFARALQKSISLLSTVLRSEAN